MHKSYKFRLFPTKKQQELLSKHFGHCRFVFNRFLSERKETYEKDNTSLNYYDNAKSLTELKTNTDFTWLKEVNSQSLQASLKNLDTAYKNFFRKQNRFPRFKSKYDNQSFKIPQNVKIEEEKLIIPKFKEGISFREHRKLEGNILFATVSKTATGKYFVSITCEQNHVSYPKTGKVVGIDTGIKELAILSNGSRYENIQSLKTSLKKLKYEQRQLSKKQKGSHSRMKQKRKLVLVHEKITNTRKDYLHKVSTEIIKNHDVIVVEDLAVKNLLKNHRLAQAMSDVSLGAFYTMLEYKANGNEKDYVKIDRFFPSSKTCSACGWINEKLKLSDRQWTCSGCGQTHDRDLNASKNILNQGLKIWSGYGTQSDIKQKREEALSLDESMNPEALPIGYAVGG